jgi:hypothetical protein
MPKIILKVQLRYPNFADIISRILDLTKINVRLLSEYLFIVYTSVFVFFKKQKKNFENLGKNRKKQFF